MRPAELARRTGLSTDTLRHYERKGLLSATRSANGYRDYPPEAVTRVRMLQGALTVGFTLDELAHLLAVRDRGGCPCQEVRGLAASKLADIEQQLEHLAVLQAELQSLLAAWDERLKRHADGGRARLLDTLPALAEKQFRRANRGTRRGTAPSPANHRDTRR